MKGLIVDLTNNNVKEKAKLFSKLIWKLIKPDYLVTDTTTEYFGRIKHPTLQLGALVFDENYIVPFNIYEEDGVTFKTRSIAIIEELIDLIYPNDTGTKKEQVRNFVKNNSGATVEQILSSEIKNGQVTGVEIKTYAEMETDGWFLNS